jgi:hypothetical protein
MNSIYTTNVHDLQEYRMKSILFLLIKSAGSNSEQSRKFLSKSNFDI